jgi:uncharacterized protein YyaL (SSP411 family)
MAAIAWLPWSAESFARARSEGKPVLLSLAPSWCWFSQQMDRSSYAEDDVAAMVASRFIPVRVDADRRPDVGERYGLGGWPTTAFLTPEGQMLGGGTFVEAARLVDVLHGVAEAFASGRHVHARAPDRGTPTTAAAALLPPEQLIARILAAFDSEHGGFGNSPKFPHVAPVRLALRLFEETGNPDYHHVALTSLDAMGWGPLYDERDGGFFRCARESDWTGPNEEKLLDVNAALLSLYVDAVGVLGLARYAQRAEDLLRYIETWLADSVDGGWAASQPADPDYYTRNAPASRRAAPPVDRTLFADWNAAMASAALEAGRVLDDPGLSQFAIKSLERVLLLCYRPGAGVAHYVEGGAAHVRGLLDDQIAMGTASLDAFEATGNVVYQMMAEELAGFAVRTMWDGEGDGFFDRCADPRRDIGLLREPLKPFAGNCRAARLLRRLARLSGSREFAEYADRALGVMAGRAAGQGPLAAEYVLAMREAPE